ncbi:arsenical resistance protein ArsH [bacterium SCSIO 12696]|nr:arsenical resistance protein ArsH [bacterium SCSIO 12696]
MALNLSVKSVVDRLLKNQAEDYRAPRFLIIYGSLREASHSRKLALEARQVLEGFGAEVKIFDPEGLPIFDGQNAGDPKVKALRELALWADGHVWISPEIHGNFSGVFKNQIDWIPLSEGAVRPTQGKTLALMQITGGSQSFNAVNNMRILGRWMRMFTIPNQSSIAKAWQEFDSDGRLKPSPFRDRVMDVLEELFRVTLLMRGQKDYLTERYSERTETQSQINQLLDEAGDIDLVPPSKTKCSTSSVTCC